MIRGITSAVMGCTGSFGSIPYLVLSSVFVEMIGAKGIWASVILLDGLMLIFLVAMILMGKYGGPPHINDGNLIVDLMKDKEVTTIFQKISLTMKLSKFTKSKF